MSLLIALIANHVCEQLTGAQYISTFWIVVIWFGHLMFHGSR